MKRVIILNGSARTGKDTFADNIIMRAYNTDDTYAHSLSTIDKVKNMCVFAGIDPNIKDYKNRKFMSDLKDLLTEHSNIPFRDVTERIEYLNDGEGANSIYIIMCREPEEIAKFKKYYENECVTVLIRRPETDVPNNHADMNVENYEYDIEISNHGSLEDLTGFAYHVCDTIFDD